MNKVIKNNIKIVFLFMVYTFTQQLFAEQSYLDNFYWGIGYNTINASVETTSKIEADNNVYGFTIGKEIHPNFDIEFKYSKGSGYDSFSNPLLEIQINSILQTSLIIKQPLNEYFQGFVKLGHASIEDSSRLVANGIVDTVERNDFTYGVGARINIAEGSFVRIEYDNFHSESSGFRSASGDANFEFTGYGVSYERSF